MPRPKQFDVEEALIKAKGLFWQQGYETTSMEDLLHAMGINRASFYGTFNSKRDVMLASLRHYNAHDRAPHLRQVTAGKLPLDAIKSIFRSMIDGSRGPKGRHGCFLVNSAMELAPADADAARIVRGGLQDVEKVFAQLISQAVERGDLSRECNPADMGRLLMSQLVGLMVLVRAGTRRSVLESVVQQVEVLLK